MADAVLIAALVLGIAMLLVIAAFVRYMFKPKPTSAEALDDEDEG